MRKSLVWALVLVFAITGAVFAETNGEEEVEPTWEEAIEARLDELEGKADSLSADVAKRPAVGGELKVEAKSEGSYLGEFKVTPSASLNVNLGGKSGENWSASVGLQALNLFGSQTVNLVDGDGNVLYDPTAQGVDPADEDTWKPYTVTVPGATLRLSNYKGTFNGDGFDVVVGRNQSVGGAKGDPFEFYQLTDYVRGTENVDRVRFSTTLAGLDLNAQLASNTKDLGLNVAGEADAFTWGVTAGVDLNDTSKNAFVFDGGVGLGIVDVYGAAGSVKGTTVWGVGAEAQVTEQLSVDAEYLHDNTWEVGAAYTEGLLKATAGFDNASDASVSLTYRGDAGNQDFGDLFKDDKYFLNVAPAFGGTYETKDSKVTLNATAPLADNFAVLGSVVLEQGKDTDISVDARYAVNEKFNITPYYYTKDSEFGSKFNYTVGAGATIALDLKSKNDVQSTTATFTIKF